MGLLSGLSSVAGTVLGAYGAYKEGQDAKDVYQYNEALAEYQAQYIREVADLEIAALERDVADYVGRQRAIQGKSGTVANIGSNADAIAKTYSEADIDASIIRWRSEKDAEAAEKGAQLLGTQADQFGRSGNINAATTLLGGLSKWDWKSAQQTSKFKATSPTGKYNVGQFGTTAYGL